MKGRSSPIYESCPSETIVSGLSVTIVSYGRCSNEQGDSSNEQVRARVTARVRASSSMRS
jgi:hypothetical protein